MAEYTPSIIRTENKQDFTETASRLIWKQISHAKNPLVCFPTGSTPLGVYKYLTEHYSDRKDVWGSVRYLALDEYAGLAPSDERLFQNWVGRELLDSANVPVSNRITFDSAAQDTDQEAARMEEQIKQNGPIDLAILGIGTNGHIAFNEPGSSFDSLTRLVSLSPETREANAAYWGGDISNVPATAYTLGLKTLARAKQIVLLVSGAHKAEILNAALNGSITTDVPASFLRTVPSVTIVADNEALGGGL